MTTTPVSHADAALTATVTTAAGPFTVIAIPDEDGGHTVIASGWTDDTADLLPVIAPGIRPGSLTAVESIGGITDAVIAYHEGDVHAIDAIPVHQHSGPYLEHAWDVLRQVSAGSPVTYTEFAARAGRPRAVRAAGSACSRNAAALFVPCHRVVPATGGVGSFRWGPDVKRWLLAHEAAHAAA